MQIMHSQSNKHSLYANFTIYSFHLINSSFLKLFESDPRLNVSIKVRKVNLKSYKDWVTLRNLGWVTPREWVVLSIPKLTLKGGILVYQKVKTISIQ